MNIEQEIIYDESFGGYINTERKTYESMPSNYIQNFLNVSVPDGNIWHYGSESFKINKYPSDIDFKQDIKYIHNLEKSIEIFQKEFNMLIKRIGSRKGVYLGDVKIGFNHIFDEIDIGILQNGRIIGFDIDKIKNKINELYKNQYIDKKEYDKINKLLHPVMTLAEYDELYEELRNLHIIRWTYDELIRGYKILPPNIKYMLNEALHDETMIKIDVWEPYNDKYIEVSNFFILYYETSNGQFKLINLPDDYFENIVPSLQREVEKFIFSTNFIKPFKAVKRMFSLARIYKDQDILSKIVPLINSNVGFLYQLNSELDLIINMFSKIKNPPFVTLMKQLDNIKYRLENITEFDINVDKNVDKLNLILDPKNKIDILTSDYDPKDKKNQKSEENKYKSLFKNFDYIQDAVEKIKQKDQLDKTINVLKEMKSYFQDVINEQTVKYLKKYDLYPPPAKYLPVYSQRKYVDQ